MALNNWILTEISRLSLASGVEPSVLEDFAQFVIDNHRKKTPKPKAVKPPKVKRLSLTAVKTAVLSHFKVADVKAFLVQNNSRYFLSRADVVAIFKTRSDYLRKMFDEAQRDDKTALILNEDYADLPDKGRYYSLSGMVKLGHVFSQNILRRNRKDWCSDVSEVVNPSMKDILKQIDARDKAITQAVKQAKTRAHQTCQVTKKKGDRVTKIPMAGHHIYSKAEYPHLVDSVDNIICITTEVHNHFHQFMGGYHIPCTLDDFERFVKQYHPDSNVLIWLQQQRLRLGDQKSIKKTKERHVLHLPWPIPPLLLPFSHANP